MYPYPTQNITTTNGFKTRNPDVDTSTWSDATLSGIISTATRNMQNYCEVDGFLTTTVSGERGKAVINSMGDLYIYPRVRPLLSQSVKAIRLVKGGFSLNLTLSGSGQQYYQVPYPYTSLNYPGTYLSTNGTMLLGGTQQLISLRGAGVYYEVDYTAGFATAPEDLVDACDLYVRDIIARRLNPVGAQAVRQGSVGFNRAIRSSNPHANIIDSIFVQQAKDILDGGGYVRTASAA